MVNIMDKSERKQSSIPYIILFVLGFTIIGLLLYIIPYRYGLRTTVFYSQTDEALNNPLTGYAPSAEYEKACEDSQLVYILLTWAEWEPSEGTYDMEGLEKKFHIARWKSENKHAVLRFVCDIPGDKEHIDIPRWLYNSTRDGSDYNTSYGKGYSPDYDNLYFRERHAQAIQALAEYCNQDTFVAYVELGSLGHWGEWHTNTAEGILPLPDVAICNQYILDYTDHFHHARLLTRRNYQIAVEGGLGLYNDMAGDMEATAVWLDWLQEGGTYDTQGEALTLLPTADRFWDLAPVGGELTSAYPRSELLGKYFPDTLETIEQGHMTFLGPNCPVGEERNSEAAMQLRERLGYRFYISKLHTEYSFVNDCLEVELTWNNVGLAPLYWDWPVTLYVYDSEGELIYWEAVDLKLTSLVPDRRIVTQSQIPFTDGTRQGFQIGIGITSPDEGSHVRLAMESEEIDEGIQIIYVYEG